MIPALSGCMSHIRIVPKTRPADIVMSTSLEQLIKQINTQYDAIQTMQANVGIVATTGGGLIGEEKDSLSFSGYIFLHKPDSLRIILRLPLVGSTGLDMVSVGCKWQLWVPPRKIAKEGTCNSGANEKGLYSLRPSVLFDSLLVRGLTPNEFVSLTSDTRVVELDRKKKDLVEEPDYDLEILTPAKNQTLHTARVIHISRIDLRPFQQDVYDADGNIVTRAFYSDYQKYGDIWFPSKIIMRRPIDQYSLTITITKLTLNQPMADDQFDPITFPPTVTIQHMN
jgi:outer membrane lipoprotein-sorting protein